MIKLGLMAVVPASIRPVPTRIPPAPKPIEKKIEIRYCDVLSFFVNHLPASLIFWSSLCQSLDNTQEGNLKFYAFYAGLRMGCCRICRTSPKEIFICDEESHFYSQCLEKLVLKRCRGKQTVRASLSRSSDSTTFLSKMPLYGTCLLSA